MLFLVANFLRLKYLAGAVTNHNKITECTPILELQIRAAAYRLAPELAECENEHIEDVLLDMEIEAISELGFRPDTVEEAAAAEKAQEIFWDAMKSALRVLWASLSDDARRLLVKCEAGGSRRDD